MSKKDILCRIENLPSLIMIKSCIIGRVFILNILICEDNKKDCCELSNRIEKIYSEKLS